VSTDEQSTENQVPVLTAWCAQRGWEVVAIFQEVGSAWESGHQPELVRLTDHASKRRFDALAVWALDRLTREGPLAILKAVDKFHGYGVKIISYQESWTEAPGELADLLFAIAGWVARMESKRRSERTKAAMVRLARDGKRLGRPPGAKDKKRRKKGSGGFHARMTKPEGAGK
jgi:DNA invertase Pin-like site-specific DNA recombinase